ncbi:NAD(P)H-dependent oxidoreductase [Streptomyces sp. NPDC012508]|uniref:NAD(P)H-dependent oxidoreductase n=1 Tax=Streptomyces sp. NPDC012508 TaxID=3364837 RepID=UPI00369ABEED
MQFPLWWYGMPAILKGWFDRVFVRGFAFGLHDEQGRQLRYGEGALAGKRAMVVVSAGAREASLGPRGINGSLDELLFPLQHGTLWYAGIDVLPPLLVHGADCVDAAAYTAHADALRRRLKDLPDTDPLPFRHQNRGDYDENLVLRPGHRRSRSPLPHGNRPSRSRPHLTSAPGECAGTSVARGRTHGDRPSIVRQRRRK